MKQLTPREKQIIELISKGQTSKVIAKDLGISQRTVDAHRSNIMQKYQVKNLAHAVRLGIERGDIGIKLDHGVYVSSSNWTTRVLG